MEQPTLESIARDNIHGYLDDIHGYTNPTNDGNLAAWMMAKSRAEALVNGLDTVCKAIANAPAHVTAYTEYDAFTQSGAV